MIDGINDQMAPFVPFMTGQYKDAHPGERPVFSAVTESPATVAPAAPTVAPQGQKPVADADLRQLFGSQPAALSAALTVQAQVADPPFVPSFREVTGSIGDGVRSFPMNRMYFATQETAQWIANKYGAGEVVEVPTLASANEYHVRLRDGRLVNAGILAGYYERNPPDKFPGLADTLIRNQLGLVS